MASFTITIEDFEGPIEALLGLIEKRKLPINDVSLASIADEYLAFINTLEEESISNKTHFIFVASTLILIKSKSLLPTLDLNSEEEGDIEHLKHQLRILEQYQEAGQLIKKNYHCIPQFYYRKPSKKSISFLPNGNLTRPILLQHLEELFQEIPEPEKLKKEASMKIAVHIDEMMSSLEERIKKIMTCSFNDFIGDYCGEKKISRELKVYRVVGFLAMLELVRKGTLDVLQKHSFENIKIEKI